MEVDSLYKLLGNPGRYHIFVYILLCLNWWPVNNNHLIMAFYGAVPSHHCAVPSGYFPDTSLPYAESDLGVRTYNSCFAYENFTTENNSTVSCPEGWEYDTDPGENTIVTQWDLVCSRGYLKNLATTIYFLGVMIGGLLFGALADRYGRRPIILITLYGPIPLGLALYFVQDYILFVVLRFFMGILFQGLQTTSFVLMMELFRPHQRSIIGTIIEQFWAAGNMWIALICFLLRDWHYIQLVISLPSILMIFQIWVIPESPRWLIANKQFTEVKDIIRKAARCNNIQFPEEAFNESSNVKLNDIVKDEEKVESDGSENGSEKKRKSYTVLDLFKTPNMRKRSLILFFVWFTLSLGYYGLSFSISSLAGNKYLNFFIGATLEVPAYALATVAVVKLGRRRPLSIFMATGGIFCIIAGCVPKKTGETDISWLSTALALLGRFGISGVFSVMFLYTSELYPTVIRNLGVGSCAFMTRFGGVIAPQVLQLGQVTFDELPIIIFGVFALGASVLGFFLPETLGCHLPDTIEDVESVDVQVTPQEKTDWK